MGLLFGFSQPQVCSWVGLLTPLLNAALGYEKQLPARRAADLQALLLECPELCENCSSMARKDRSVDPQHQGATQKGLQRQEKAPHQKERARGRSTEKAGALSFAHPPRA
jgi:hypothetical protein